MEWGTSCDFLQIFCDTSFVRMMNILRKIWPLFIGISLLILVSYFVQGHLETLKAFLHNSSNTLNIIVYLLIGITTVVIPFGTLIPFIPIAVALWGWPLTALLTFLSWILGSQLLFEASRAFGKPLIKSVMIPSHVKTIASLVDDKGILSAIFIRMVVHADMVSYAFGMFTNVNRWKFLLITAVGVAPGAITYSYFGSLPLPYQIGMALVGLAAAGAYWAYDARKHPSSSAEIIDIPQI